MQHSRYRFLFQNGAIKETENGPMMSVQTTGIEVAWKSSPSAIMILHESLYILSS